MSYYLFNRLMVTLILLILYGATSLQAQTQMKDRVYFGFKFGGYTGLYKGDNYFSKDLGYKIGSKSNFHAGVFLEIPTSKHLALQPEILLYEGGYYWYTEERFGARGDNGDYDVNEELGYVSIPVLLKYKVGGLGIYAGLQPDFLFFTMRDIEGRSTSANEDDFRKDYKKGVYLSGIGGIEYTFRFGLGVSARYQLGLTNIANPTQLGLYERGNNINTNAFLYGIHWRIGKPRKVS
ncbi:porin family protein [Terrimonas sp.]|uniref:porin family protein n=1 Tax=Terrimonas sp. TaxID=1914338 RepID=UPI00140378E6|nr:porin family protein [Terrimonas sp.]